MTAMFKVMHWVPRIIVILAILFVSMFALDSFSPGLTLWQQIGGFMIHLIPSFILLGVLVLAWKRELPGGIIFLLIGVGLSPWIYLHNFRMNHSVGMSLLIVLMVTFPFILAGIMFIVSHFVRKRNLLKMPPVQAGAER
jgi:hypothetical protein